MHLFVLGDGLAPETKSMKLYEVDRYEAWGRKVRRACSVVLPGSAQLLEGRAWVGWGLVVLWLLAWIAGFPEILAPVERGLGADFHLAGLRPGPLPDVYGLDAAVLVAIPLGLIVWIAGNFGARRARGA